MFQEEHVDLQAALRELENWKGDAKANGQRRFTRFPARGQARAWPGENIEGVEPVGTLQVRDISRSGVGLLSGTPATPGQFWQLQLGDDRVIAATLPAVCRYCRQVTNGAYLIGAEFGVDGAILLALGVPAQAIALGDEPEKDRQAVPGDFIDPKLVIESEAD
jgi:hypothetical protein